jgi:hypothetical protein
MKLLLALIAFIAISGTCKKTTSGNNAGNDVATGKQPGRNCYKARLEIKGICMNYVIKVLEGDTAALKLEKSWTDETDNKTYTNVFALGSPCAFPDIAEGAEFYFTLSQKEDAGCNVCMAYRPVPAAKNNIVVSKNACP